MSLSDYITHSYIKLEEEQANQLSLPPADQYVIEVRPPRSGDIPTTLNRFIRNIMEIQSKWFGLANASPLTVFEIRRTQSGTLRFQLVVSLKRMERKIRTHLTEEIPGIGFETGVSGLPVTEGDPIGGGILTLGREDYHPLRRKFDRPPMNSVAVALHRHAMKDSSIIIQIAFQPVAGNPIRRWWKMRRAYKQIGYLRKEKHAIVPWHDRPATPSERKQADQIEQKARNPHFKVAIRILVIGAGEHTPSRVKEIEGSFNVLEDPVSNQFLDIYTIKPVFASRILDFADTVRRRHPTKWAIPFHVSPEELAALVTLPNRQQRNINYAEP